MMEGIKMIITGSYSSKNNAYKMHEPMFPYKSTVYLGFTLEGMKRQYRIDNNLQKKHIEWIIVGL